MKICRKHNLPKIWGRREGTGVYKYCTQCLDEEWEQDFKPIRGKWKKITPDEILIEVGLFYEWILDKGYSKGYAKGVSFRVKYLLNIFREKRIEINEENIRNILKNRRPYLRTSYIHAFKRFKEFKEELESTKCL